MLFLCPDAERRQQADCKLTLLATSNGKTFDQALVVVGANKTVELEMAFQVPTGVTGWVLKWPGKVHFSTS